VTLLVAMIRKDVAILLADRRLSRAGQILDDEYNKICVFFCKDGKIAIAFTGVATVGTFSTANWIAETLADATTENTTISDAIETLRARLGPKMQSLGIADSRLTLLCVGYRYWSEHPEPCLYEISNVGQNGAVNSDAMLCVLSPGPGTQSVVELAGAVNAVPTVTLKRLKCLFANAHLKPQDILRFSVQHLQNASRSSATLNSIGEQCNSAILSRAIDTVVTSTYHSAYRTSRAYAANVVIAGSSFTGIQMVSSQVLAGPEIREKDACWCGSGVRFGKCHMKKFGATYAQVSSFKSPLPLSTRMVRQEAWPSGRVFCVSSSFV
jgi:SEC-C motif